jgi:hypothetical protein
LREYRILLKALPLSYHVVRNNRFVNNIRQQPAQMFEIVGEPRTDASRSMDCRKREIPVLLSEHGYNRFIVLSRMSKKAFIRANDEF